MSTADGVDVVAGGPPDDDGPGSTQARRRPPAPYVLVGAGTVAGLLLGWAMWGSGGSSAEPAPGPSGSASSAARTEPDGVVLPQVVDAVTLPETGNRSVVTLLPVGSSQPRYDYSIAAAPWLAPDGSMRSGPPGCTLPATGVQHLQVAVVHSRAYAGGPNWDTVVWYRCAPAGG